MRLRDLLEHIQQREFDCPCCYQRYPTITIRFDHVLRVHARDYDEAVQILDEHMMPLFDNRYASGPDDVELIGVTNEDYVTVLADDGDAVAKAYSSGEQ